MKKIDPERMFLDEKIMRNIAIISAFCGVASMLLMGVANELELFPAFEKMVKIIMTLFTLWAFSKIHWDVAEGMMGGLLFALLYQEGFVVLGKLWGETSDFDAFLIMGIPGSLYLACQSMSFLMTIIIIINHFIIDYSRIGNYGNVVFNQVSIIFKILLYVFLIIINAFLKQPTLMQINSVFENLSDLCIVILVICIETQLDSFKAIRQDLLQAKKKKEDKI